MTGVYFTTPELDDVPQLIEKFHPEDKDMALRHANELNNHLPPEKLQEGYYYYVN